MTRCARCDWAPDPDATTSRHEQLAEHALAASHPLCSCCGRSLAQDDPAQACEACLTDARSLLSGIVTMWGELPTHLGHARAQRYDSGPRGGEEHHLPGGTVFALLAPGSAGGAPRRLTSTDVERGLDGREHGVDNQPEDAPSVAWALTSWEDDWRHTRGEVASTMPPSSTSAVVRAAAHYLEVHARWAANQHSAFDEFAEDLRALHTRLEVATHRRRTPTRAGASCFDCGGDLVRQVDPDTGLEAEEVVTCRRCRSSYDGARYLLALAARRQQGLDGWVSVPAAAQASKRPVKTLRSWLGEHVPWALRIEARQPTADDPRPWRVVEHLAWYPALAERAERVQRRRRSA